MNTLNSLGRPDAPVLTPVVSDSAESSGKPAISVLTTPVEATKNNSVSEAGHSAIILDSASNFSTEDLLVALMALKEKIRSNQLESSGLDIQYKSSIANQLHEASENLTTKKTALESASDVEKAARQKKDKAQDGVKKAQKNLDKADSALKAAEENFQRLKQTEQEKEEVATRANEQVQRAEQAAEQARKAAIEAAQKAANASPGEKESLEKAAEAAGLKADQAKDRLRDAKDHQAQAMVAVDQAKTAVSQQEVTVNKAKSDQETTSAALSEAKSTLATATAGHNAATEHLKSAEADVEEAESNVQAANYAYNSVMSSIEQRLQTTLGDIAKQDTTGASAVLNNLITSGSAMAAALTSIILENTVSSDFQNGLSHSAKLKLINQAASSEERVKQAEQAEKNVMKAELSADLAQLFIGTVAAFSVFGASKLKEVAAMNSGMVSHPLDAGQASNGRLSDEGFSSEITAANLKEGVAGTAASLQAVLNSAQALLEDSGSFGGDISTKPVRGVVNKV
ncbi:hypothetical protein [Endozoicomonas sp. Mp262]|uniref:hypothetical protein n=1 Tax=Endozoicomonas sp. Mp262 TaxID=2919499 RepID=UPI0021DA494E